MYLIIIGWIYVVLMMSVAEATNSNGTLLGALVTFVLYGVGPVILVAYLMGAPSRSKALKKREAEAHAYQITRQDSAAQAVAEPTPDRNRATASVQPDARSHAPGGSEAVAIDTSVAPVGKET